MIEQVDSAGDAELLQQFGNLRPHALQRLDLGEQGIEDVGAHEALLACHPALAMRGGHDYMRAMPSDPDLKRLHWRAHHRGTREADALIGGFFDARHDGWSLDDCDLFNALLEEQDVDIMAWALGTATAPERFQGPMLESMKRLDYIRILR